MTNEFEAPPSMDRPTDGPEKYSEPHSARSRYSVNSCSTALVTRQVLISCWPSRPQTMSFPRSPLTHCPLTSIYIPTVVFPLTWTVRYAAGIDWRTVEVGVMGDRN